MVKSPLNLELTGWMSQPQKPPKKRGAIERVIATLSERIFGDFRLVEKGGKGFKKSRWPFNK